jgi:FSR family fosmidomycin resistance protein-like MFS transporter
MELDNYIMDRRAVFSIVLICLGHFVIDFMNGIWPVYKAMANMDLALAGLVMGIGVFFGEILELFSGILNDRGHGRKLILLSFSITSAAVFYPYVNCTLGYLALFMITYSASGLFHPVGGSLMSSISPKNRGLMVTLFAVSGTFGLAISQISYMYVCKFFSGHTEYLAIPAVLLFVAAHCFFDSKYSTPQNTNKEHASRSMKGFFILLKHQGIRTLYLMMVFNQLLLWAFIFLLPNILKERQYVDWISFGLGHFFFAIGAVVMMIPGGYLSDKYSEKKVIFVATVLSLVFLNCFIFLPQLSSDVLLGLLFSFGSTIFLIHPVAIAQGVRLLPQASGMISALMMGMVWVIAESLGPFISGVVAHLFAEGAATSALLFTSIFLWISLVFAWHLPGPLPIAKEVEEVEEVEG